MTSRYPATLRELSNNSLAGSYSLDTKPAATVAPTAGTATRTDSYNSLGSSVDSNGYYRALHNNNTNTASNTNTNSPHADRSLRHNPLHVSEMAADIADMFFKTEQAPRNRVRSDFLTTQAEVTEKMRVIVVDWLVDVVVKFRLHPETYYLAVNVMDRYLSVAPTTRVQLQLVGITSLLIAAKYEEMFAPDVRECIKITANTYTRDDIIRMERAICAALSFRFTTPTAYVFLSRLLAVGHCDATITNAAQYFLEHAAMDYQLLQFLPSQVGAAAMYLANLMILTNRNGGVTPASSVLWSNDMSYYSHYKASELRPVCEELLRFCNHVATARYQAVRRKYSSPRLSEISTRPMPTALPAEM